ncbi:MAG TPA: class A beta-lactamase-related serine hydrolase [Lacibacter sp.]|nr:class A beta-lactamase-related serine hydrolase [Lacibacter sp.]HMO90105.1 class A beta-lactamase-related serine hydrolase [Lacibacter sp.]HMP88347.1 class A beta-lactamase-related serine hydrolase [Lacibacter sp.]
MKPIFLLLLPLLFFLQAASAQRSDLRLERRVKEVLAGFRGDVGVYVKNLKNGRIVAIAADTVFPTASMIKVPILVGVMDKIEQKELDYHGKIVYKDSLYYAGEDVLGSLKHGEAIELSKVMMLMLTLSDNTASLWLQGLAGGGQRINQLIDSLGLQHTRVNSRTPGREANRTRYGWGQTTPREMATLLEKIYRGEVINHGASNRMLRLLGRNHWDEEGLSATPPTIEVFSKNGAVNASRSEVMLVNAPRRPYVFCIITKNNQDQRWDADNEAWQLTRRLSALLWNYFEPRYRR